jgi:GNAT superfamily N-acetyltransferase
MDRLAEGQIVYTLSEGGRLLHYAWVAHRSGPAPSGLGNQVYFPPDSRVLWDDYTHPAARGRGLHKASIQARIYDAFTNGAKAVFINVYAGNTPSRRNIEAAGFTHIGSMVRHIRFGKIELKWEAANEQYRSFGNPPPEPPKAQS